MMPKEGGPLVEAVPAEHGFPSELRHFAELIQDEVFEAVVAQSRRDRLGGPLLMSAVSIRRTLHRRRNYFNCRAVRSRLNVWKVEAETRMCGLCAVAVLVAREPGRPVDALLHDLSTSTRRN